LPPKDPTFRTLNRTVGKAIHRYRMIADGDRVLVALSGGKDSLTLLWILNERLRRVPVRYELAAAFIDPGFQDGVATELQDCCRRWDTPFYVVHTDDGLLAHSDENRENPCFLCARKRRQRLFELAEGLGFSKIALGHNKDDLIETLFLNILFAGQIAAIAPSQCFFDGRFSVIRPLALTEEKTIARFVEEQQFPCLTNPCPSARSSKRREVKELLESLYLRNDKIKGNIFHAIRRLELDFRTS